MVSGTYVGFHYRICFEYRIQTTGAEPAMYQVLTTRCGMRLATRRGVSMLSSASIDLDVSHDASGFEANKEITVARGVPYHDISSGVAESVCTYSTRRCSVIIVWLPIWRVSGGMDSVWCGRQGWAAQHSREGFQVTRSKWSYLKISRVCLRNADCLFGFALSRYFVRPQSTSWEFMRSYFYPARDDRKKECSGHAALTGESRHPAIFRKLSYLPRKNIPSSFANCEKGPIPFRHVSFSADAFRAQIRWSWAEGSGSAKQAYLIGSLKPRSSASNEARIAPERVGKRNFAWDLRMKAYSKDNSDGWMDCELLNTCGHTLFRTTPILWICNKTAAMIVFMLCW